jgi:hypothetical protein
LALERLISSDFVFRFSGPLLRTITPSLPFLYSYTNTLLKAFSSINLQEESIDIESERTHIHTIKKDPLFSYAILRSFHIIIQYPKCLIAVALIPKIFT